MRFFKQSRLIWIYIWRTPMLRVLFVVLLTLFCFIPAYLYKIIYPEFRTYVEQQSNITAILMAKQLLYPLDFEEIVDVKPFPASARTFLKNSVESGMIYAVRVYDRKGACVFSTTTPNPDIGETPLFRNNIMRGEPYSRMLRAGEEHEPLFSATDMTETFLPVMESGVFSGAIVLYQRTTFETQSLENLAEHAVLMVIGLLFVMGLFKWLLMVHLSKQERTRRRLEGQIRRTNTHLSQRVAAQTYEISLGQQITVSALAKMAEYNDSDTGKHLSRMSTYARELAFELRRKSPYSRQIIQEGLDGDTFGMAAVLHDIGKIAIPEQVLGKPGRLTKEEFTLMKRHTLIGADVLGEANQHFIRKIGKDSYLKPAADVARNHHEKWNGTGYWGLAGEAIPLSARIVAIADVYDALRSRRPYKEPWTHADTVQEILASDGHFDPVIVAAFQNLTDRFNTIWEDSNSLPHTP
ncbi:MAG: HD domain-containing protein [Bilophila sp.]